MKVPPHLKRVATLPCEILAPFLTQSSAAGFYSLSFIINILYGQSSLTVAAGWTNDDFDVPMYQLNRSERPAFAVARSTNVSNAVTQSNSKDTCRGGLQEAKVTNQRNKHFQRS